jgi:hypothetical protein
MVKLGEIPLVGFKLDNIRAPSDLGPHKYDNGLISFDLADNRGCFSGQPINDAKPYQVAISCQIDSWNADDENNGLVYTCRGGFIDVAHVRDNADMTIFLAAQAGRNMNKGGIIKLPDQGGEIHIIFNPIPKELLNEYGHRQA